MFGDSLTWQAEGSTFAVPGRLLTDQFIDAGFSPSISAMIGASTPMLARVTGLKRDGTPMVPPPGADILVIALGTNDMHVKDGAPAVPLATAVANIDAAIAAVGADCTVLVTIAETAPWGLDVTGPAYNAALRDRADVVADWATVAAAHPSFLLSDQVHHTLDGRAAYRAVIVDAVRTCPPPQGETSDD